MIILFMFTVPASHLLIQSVCFLFLCFYLFTFTKNPPRTRNLFFFHCGEHECEISTSSTIYAIYMTSTVLSVDILGFLICGIWTNRALSFQNDRNCNFHILWPEGRFSDEFSFRYYDAKNQIVCNLIVLT